jgi:hypothetical protein
VNVSFKGITQVLGIDLDAVYLKQTIIIIERRKTIVIQCDMLGTRSTIQLTYNTLPFFFFS